MQYFLSSFVLLTNIYHFISAVKALSFSLLFTVNFTTYISTHGRSHIESQRPLSGSFGFSASQLQIGCIHVTIFVVERTQRFFTEV